MFLTWLKKFLFRTLVWKLAIQIAIDPVWPDQSLCLIYVLKWNKQNKKFCQFFLSFVVYWSDKQKTNCSYLFSLNALDTCSFISSTFSKLKGAQSANLPKKCLIFSVSNRNLTTVGMMLWSNAMLIHNIEVNGKIGISFKMRLFDSFSNTVRSRFRHYQEKRTKVGAF